MEINALGFNLVGYLQTPLTWLVIIVGVGFLIFIHELGHFLVAKYEKVKVETFALGFGYGIFKRQWGETEYRINILPLGGYVKMKGELPGEEIKGDPDEFTSKKPQQRARILVAGVAMNALFGLVAAIVAFQLGVRFMEPTIGWVETGGPAWRAGIRAGDRILEVDGRQVDRFRELFNAVAFSSSGDSVRVKLERDQKVVDCEVFPEYDEEHGLPTIKVEPKRDLWLRNDEGRWRIVEIEGREIRHPYEFNSALQKIAGTSVTLTVEDEGERREFTIHAPKTRKVHRLGIVNRQLKIGEILPSTLASRGGLEKGDVILEVNGEAVPNKEGLRKLLEESPSCAITVERSGERETCRISPWSSGCADEFVHGVHFVPDVYIGEIVAASPAAKVLKPGDKIVGIDGKPIAEWKDVYEMVEAAGKKEEVPTLRLKILRTGEEHDILITPRYELPEFDADIEITPRMTVPQYRGIWQSCKHGLFDAKEMVTEVVLMFKALFTRRISPKNLGGPITIFQVSHTYLSHWGPVEYLYLLALLSINLAVINLLPIPVLDGGHLMFVGLEKLRGKPVPQKVLIGANNVGLLLLLALMIYVTFNDIVRCFFF